jgi:RNA polymerase sigma factor (sigma-70 family)
VDAALFTVELDRHRRYLIRIAQLQLRDADLAEDVVQETLVAALGARDGFSGRSSVKTWLTGILKHKIVDAIRSPDPDPEHIRSLLAARWQGGPLGTLATRNPLLALHRQAPYRTMRAMVSSG